MTIQTDLRARQAFLSAEVTRLQTECQRLDGAAHELAPASSTLDRWLFENEPKVEHLRAASASKGLTHVYIDPDEAIVAADLLSQQGLKAKAFLKATEDATMALDRAFETKKVKLEDYLRQIRTISRRQFTALAVLSKVEAKRATERRTAALKPATPGAGLCTPPAQPPIGNSSFYTGATLVNPFAVAARKMSIKR